jgi:ferredoxin
MSMQEATSHGGGVEVATRTEFRVWIDQDLCTGDGLCVDVVPEVFTLLEDGIAYVCEDGAALNDPGMAEGQAAVPQEHEKAVVRAALICPGECIFIENGSVA